MRKTLYRLEVALLLLVPLSGILLMCLAITNPSQTGFDGTTDNIVSEPAVSEDMTANDESEGPHFWDVFFVVFSIFGCIALGAVFVLMFIIIRDGE